MKAKDVMTHRVISVEPMAAISQAIRLMLQNKISGLPVVDAGGHLVGIVTEGDFLRRSEMATDKKRSRLLEFLLGSGQSADNYVRSHGRKVEEVMTRDVHTVSEDTSLEDVVRTMEKRRIKRLPVVRGRRIVGIISRANLLHALASVAREIKPTTNDDESIRARLLKELDKETWAPAALVNVVFRKGIVDLHGGITDERQRPALVVMAENIPGVKGVRDHLVWIEPMSGAIVYSPGDEKQKARAS